MQLSFEEDEWIREYKEGHPIWIATLDDNTSVYCDDGRYEKSAWIRLKEYCRQSNKQIKYIRFGFRSNMFRSPENCQGYYFARSCRGYFGDDSTLQMWNMGHIENGKLIITKWLVPEMQVIESETRELSYNEECLIVNQS